MSQPDSCQVGGAVALTQVQQDRECLLESQASTSPNHKEVFGGRAHSQRWLGLVVAMSFLWFLFFFYQCLRFFFLGSFCALTVLVSSKGRLSLTSFIFTSSHKAAGEKKGFMAFLKEISMKSLLQEWRDTLRSFGKGLWARDLCFQDLDNFKIKLKYGFIKDYQGQRFQAWESLHLQSWIWSQRRLCHGTRRVKEIEILHVSRGEQLHSSIFPQIQLCAFRPCIKNNVYTCFSWRMRMILKIRSLRLSCLCYASELPPPFTV